MINWKSALLIWALVTSHNVILLCVLFAGRCLLTYLRTPASFRKIVDLRHQALVDKDRAQRRQAGRVA